MKNPARKYVSQEEYLEMESIALQKHEYFNGEIIAMAGASQFHNRISRNLITEIGSFLKGKSCEVFGSDYRVTTPLFDSYMYPDVMIVCGKPEEKTDSFDTLTNPSVIIEILSTSTSDKDKNYKFLYYIQIPSLKEYFLIDSNRNYIASFKKQDDQTWKLTTTENINKSLTIETIQLQIQLKDIYYMVLL